MEGPSGTASSVSGTTGLFEDTATIAPIPEDKMEPQFWVYTHDLEGDLIENVGDFFTFDEVFAAVSEVINNVRFDPMTMVLRVVDNADDSQTCWLAGNTEYMKDFYAAHFGVEERDKW